MRRGWVVVAVAGLVAVGLAGRQAAGHCQVPCGIYDDDARMNGILEDIRTIEVAMQNLGTLAGEEPVNFPQIVRWTMAKEEHARRIQQTVADYFLVQRVRPVAAEGEGREAYVAQLTTLHRLMVAAMRARQTVDPVHVGEMREALQAFHEAYPHGH